MVVVVGLLAMLSRSSDVGAATPSHGNSYNGTTSYDLKEVQRALQHVLDQATLDLTARLQTGRLQVLAYASAQLLICASVRPDLCKLILPSGGSPGTSRDDAGWVCERCRRSHGADRGGQQVTP